MIVRLVQLLDVAGVHVLFVGPAPPGDAAHQRFRIRLQVDDHVGGHDLELEPADEPVVQRQLLFGEVEAREDPILLEQVVRHRALAEQLHLAQVALLLEAAEQKVHLGLKRVSLAVLVEVLEKRVLFDFLEHELRL